MKKRLVLILIFGVAILTAKFGITQDVSGSGTLITGTSNLRDLASSIEKFRTATDASSFVAHVTVSEKGIIRRPGEAEKVRISSIRCLTISDQGHLLADRFYDKTRLPIKRSTILLKGEIGQALEIYSDKEREYSIGKVDERKNFVKNVFTRTLSQADPRYYAYYASNSAIDKAILKKTGSEIDNWPQWRVVGEKTIYGSRCVLLEKPFPAGEGAYVYALDREHDLIIREVSTYRTGQKGRVLTDVLSVPRIIEQDGIWYPSYVEEKIGIASTKPGGAIASGTRTVEYVISPVKEDGKALLETIRWPVGCEVQDSINNQTFNIVSTKPIAIREDVEGAPSLSRVEDDPTVIIAVPIPQVEVEKPSLDFTATDMNGKTWKLSDLKGKKTLLLTFFPKCFTGGCANHLSSLRDQQAAFDAADTQILAVSVDAADGERGQIAFAQQWKLGFPLIPDTQRTLSKLFGAAQNDKQLAARMTILIDKQGIVRLIDTNVNVRTHGADVLAKMREMKLAP